jgi:hypothetical protein
MEISRTQYDFLISGERHSLQMEWPNDDIELEWKPQGSVIGCGLLLDPKSEMAIFFTVNGKILRQFMGNLARKYYKI